MSSSEVASHAQIPGKAASWSLQKMQELVTGKGGRRGGREGVGKLS